MTRLAALEKLLYYPTPLNLAADLGGHISRPFKVANGEIDLWILDPCAGDGAAVEKFRDAWLPQAKIKAIELDAERASACRSRFGEENVIEGAFEQTECGGFGVVFLNPPYSSDTTEKRVSLGHVAERQEVSFLRRAITALSQHGIVIWIVPEYILMDRMPVLSTLGSISDVRVLRFPEPEYQQFKQVAVLMKRTSGFSNFNANETKVHAWSNTPPRVWPYYGDQMRAPEGSLLLPRFRHITFDLDALPDGSSGVFKSADWRQAFPNVTNPLSPPLLPLRKGHQALLMAAGAFDGVEIGDEIVRGVSQRRTVKVITEEEDISREFVDTTFSFLNLKTGEFKSLIASSNQEEIKAWLTTHADQLAHEVEASLPPTTPNLDTFVPKGRAPRKSTWFPAQIRAIAGVVHGVKTQKSVLLAGEQGVGKTAIISAALKELDKRAIVMCPSHLVDKWAAEFSDVTRLPSMVVESIEDIEALDDEVRLIVVSKERAKLGAPWRNAAVKDKKGNLRCPRCNNYVSAVLVEARAKMYCECGEALWQCVRMAGGTGKARWPLAKILAKRFKSDFLLVLDETHQYAAMDSDQSQAASHLAAHASGCIIGTGTLWDGKASGLFYILHRVRPEFRRLFSHGDSERFVRTHGTMESVTKIDPSTAAYGGRRNQVPRVREVPGIDPALFKHLIHWSVFIRMRDLEMALPKYREEIILVESESQIQTRAMEYLHEAKRLRYEDPSAAALAFSDALAWADAPTDLLGDTPSEKELCLTNLILDERDRGRGVIVYCTQINKRDTYERLERVLTKHGLRVAILRREDSEPRQRDKLFKRLSKNTDVILTNGSLVETGLDLLWGATIVQYGVEMSSKRFRQSVRRSWRIGQAQSVDVLILAYRGTPQEAYTKLLANKVKAASLLEDDPISALAMHATNDFDLLTAVRKSLGV